MIRLKVNGAHQRFESAPETRLLCYLRDRLLICVFKIVLLGVAVSAAFFAVNSTSLRQSTSDAGKGSKGGVLDGISVLGNRLFVNTLQSSKLFTVPIQAGGKAGAITEMKLDHAINNPDGMRSFGNDSLLIVEGGGQGRLSRIKIDGNSVQVAMLKEGYPDGAGRRHGCGNNGVRTRRPARRDTRKARSEPVACG
jgi:hypothetical protein